MPLSAGTRLGPYEIVAALGAGGMGEVYKARDTRLERTVAIKILPAALAGDPEFAERFEREARVISSLDHPNICALYDVGTTPGAADANDPSRPVPGVSFLVMQYVDGRTLADRLSGGPLPIAQVLRLAIEMADALDHAHRCGIVHRDLKPANVMLTGPGAPRGASPSKLLDFGLAKLRHTPPPVGLSGATRMADQPVTAQGTILGTVQYMAPEQVEGRETDARTDLFAFGAILYEMVTGARPFAGSTPASIMSAILRDTPPPVTTRQPLAPLALDHLISTCLAKDPDERWQSAGDVKRQLLWIQSTLSASGTAGAPAAGAPVRQRRAWRLAAIVGLLALAAVGGVAAYRRWAPAASSPVVRFEIFAPQGAPFSGVGASVPTTQFAISPDGERIVFVASPPGQRPTLWVRTLESTQPQLLTGTEDAAAPFWSPDSRFVGFFAQNRLKKIDLRGGPPQTLCDCDVSPDARGGAWNRDDVILFARSAASGLDRISAASGTATPAFPLRPGESSYRWPSFLPDGRHFVVHVRAAERPGVYLGSLDDNSLVPLLERTPFNALVSPTGHLLTVREGTLLAYPFDLGRRRINGDPVRVAEQVGGSSAQLASFSVSDAGVLAYSTGFITPSRLEWFDRSGKPRGQATDVGDYVNFRLSPDGKKVAFTRVDLQTHTSDIWLLELGRGGTEIRFTSHPGTDTAPVWSPDSTQILFRSDRAGGNFAFVKPVSGAESERHVTSFKANVSFPTDWSPDGKFIAFHGPVKQGSYDLSVIDWPDGSKLTPFAESVFTEMDGHFSVDGRLLAYASDVSGRMEVYVQPFPKSGSAIRVSVNGGSEPHWRQDGKELFFLGADRMVMTVPVIPGPSFQNGPPQPLFQSRVPFIASPYRLNYDVNADGSLFLITTPAERAGTSTSITVVLNWAAEMARK
jgi:Tol biopolymer transport system component